MNSFHLHVVQELHQLGDNLLIVNARLLLLDISRLLLLLLFIFLSDHVLKLGAQLADRTSREKLLDFFPIVSVLLGSLD